MVSKTKWMEPRHTVNVTNRFTRDKTDSLQHAFFNGQGYAVLENLWGFWYGMNPNDAEAVLRFTAIERAMANNLRRPDWQPHAATVQAGVFASRFPNHSRTLWTIVNRNEYDVAGPELRVPFPAGVHFYDLWHGVVLATGEDPPSDKLKDILAYMAQRSRRPLSSFSREWQAVLQTMVDIRATNPCPPRLLAWS